MIFKTTAGERAKYNNYSFKQSLCRIAIIVGVILIIVL